jgi:hypothetical protein
MALLPGYPSRAPTPAFRRRSVRTLCYAAEKPHEIPVMVPLDKLESIREHLLLKKYISRAEREILALV